MVKLIDLSSAHIHGHKLSNIPKEKKKLLLVALASFFLLKEIQIVHEIKSNFKILLGLCQWAFMQMTNCRHND